MSESERIRKLEREKRELREANVSLFVTVVELKSVLARATRAKRHRQVNMGPPH